MTNDDLAYLSALEAKALFTKRQLSPLELLDAVIARAEQFNPAINAFSDQLYERGRVAAKRAEQAYLRGEEGGLLCGIPLAAKEKHAIAGESLSNGLQLKHTPLASQSHPIIQRIEAAGGVLMARTTTPEFSCATFTHSPLWGVTRNPYHLDYSPGGSSGGSAAALAAGMTTLATASDIGGSTRLPAAFTGCVGYKPPYGRVPGCGPLAADHYRSDNAMARTVGDVALLSNVLAGLDANDHSSVPPHQPLPLSWHGDLRGKRIALCIQLGDYLVAPDMEANTRHVAQVLAEAGATVEEITLPWRSADIMHIAMLHYAHILVPGVLGALSETSSHTPYLQRFIEVASEHAERGNYLDALTGEAHLQQQLAQAMQGFDVLLCPASATTGLLAGEDYLDGISLPNAEQQAVHLAHYWQSHMAVPFNIANRCPVLAVPSGMADIGIPTGVQIVGHPWAEHSVFEVAAALELSGAIRLARPVISP